MVVGTFGIQNGLPVFKNLSAHAHTTSLRSLDVDVCMCRKHRAMEVEEISATSP